MSTVSGRTRVRLGSFVSVDALRMLSPILFHAAITLAAALCFRRAALRLYSAADEVVCISCRALGADPRWDGTFTVEQGATWRRDRKSVV